MNDWMEAMEARHSVRAYTDEPVSREAAEELQNLAEYSNAASGLHIQLCLNEPNAFQSNMASYGSFKNVKNYIALVGKKSPELEEKCGYWGEKLVLRAQQLGLNTCWVALTYNKKQTACTVLPGEKLVCVISLGYGLSQGTEHKSKALESLCKTDGPIPDWFRRGMEAALLAPTAMNQQKFMFSLQGNAVSVKAGMGFYTKLDLGIVKCHFELGAEGADWHWVN